MHDLFVLVVGAVVVFGVANVVLGQGRGGVPRVVARELLTPREIAFWRLLRGVAEPYHVAPQVAMNALLNAEPGLDPKRRQGTRNRFDRNVVDFALIDDDGSVRLLIELDDRTHRSDRDAARDRMTERAGYSTLRVNGREAREPHLLAAAIADKIAA